ncbi:MAG: hypothetical protein ABSG83_00800 [Roseiarcus sp.]
MRRILLTLSFALLIQSASAATTGQAGLALAAIVAGYSPHFCWSHKHLVERLFEGRENFVFPAGHTIDIAADSIVCRAGDVDIAARSCALKFGARTVKISGRRANELYATMIEADAPSDGAAGTIFESLNHLACVIDRNAVKRNDGGGASCAFGPGP